MDPKNQLRLLREKIEQMESISVNNEDLYDPDIHLPDKPDFMDRSLNYEESTPLSDQLIKLIGLR